MGLKEDLELISQFPRVKMVGFQEGKLCHVELFPTISPVQTQVLPEATDMPPDDVMLFASTPTFDEMVDKANNKE
jgi:hypothetical protein